MTYGASSGHLAREAFWTTTILKGVDLDVGAGQFCVLVGSSGCGKSTLLRCIAGLEEPEEGGIYFGDKNVTHLEPRERDIAMVFQSYALYPHLTVADNLAFGLKLRRMPSAEIQKRISDVSEMLGLSALLTRYPRELSGGQRQRVAMGRAIARRSPIYLFDEPLSNLDAKLRGQVRVEIRKLHDQLGATSIYVTHDQVEAMTLADIMVVLHQGRVEQIGAPLEVYRQPASKFVAGFLGTPTMAFLPAKIVNRKTVKLDSGAELAVDLVAGEPGQKVEIGVRAQDVLIEPSGSLSGKVEVVEALGSETFAHVQGEGWQMVVRSDADRLIRRGEQVKLKIPPSAIHVFDLGNERRVPAVHDKPVA